MAKLVGIREVVHEAVPFQLVRTAGMGAGEEKAGIGMSPWLVLAIGLGLIVFGSATRRAA